MNASCAYIYADYQTQPAQNNKGKGMIKISVKELGGADSTPIEMVNIRASSFTHSLLDVHIDAAFMV